MAPSMSLQSSYPWTTTPFIANAPMGGFANSALAISVTQAKGFGFIGAVFDIVALATELEQSIDDIAWCKIPRE